MLGPPQAHKVRKKIQEREKEVLHLVTTCQQLPAYSSHVAMATKKFIYQLISRLKKYYQEAFVSFVYKALLH